MSSHTPGPWEIKRHYDPGYKFISAQKHSGLAQVVWCMEDEDRSPECEANAYLIAAAPDLLAACEGLLNALPSATTHPAIKAARAAIAKAKGERRVLPSPQGPDSFSIEAVRSAFAKAKGEDNE